MPKLKAPLFSLKATGRLGKLLTLAKRQGRHIIERRPIPTDAKSPSQLFSRLMFNKCIDLWHLLSDAERQEWESLARPRHMTGYAWYISQCLRPNPGIYLPLIGGTMTGDIDMGKHSILKLPLPTDAQEAASKAYVDALAPGLHAATHENGGADEIDVGGLAGLLADDQHVLDAEVNALIAIHTAIATAHQDAPALITAHGIGAKHRWTLNKLRLGAGAGANPTEIDVPSVGIWTLLETLNPAGVATISSSALAAHDLFMVILVVSVSSANSVIRMRLNGDTGPDYNSRYINGTTFTVASSRTYVDIVRGDAIGAFVLATLYIPGTLNASEIPISTSVASRDHFDLQLLNATYEASADITSLTFFPSSGNITGTIKIYGMDF